MSDTEIASISIPVRVDFSDLKRDLNSLQSFALPRINLKPTVDHSELTKLNQHLDIKERHYRQLSDYFRSNPLTPKVDTSDIRRATKEIRDFQDSLKRGNYSLPTITQKVELQINGDEIEKVFRKSAGSANLGNIFSGLLTAPFKLVAEAGKQVFIGTFQAIGNPLGNELGKGIKDGLERELSFSVGSLSLIGRKMGKAVSSEIAEVMAEELGLVSNVLTDLMGKTETVREGAAVRRKQGQQSSQTNQAGSEQIYREYEFFKQNASELRARTEALSAKQVNASQLEREIREKVGKAAEALGVGRLQQALTAIGAQREKVVNQAQQPNLSSADQQAITSSLQRLGNRSSNLVEQINSVNLAAENRYRSDLDRIARIKERLQAEERQLLRVIEAPDRLDFAIRPPTKSKPINTDQLPQSYVSVAKQVAELTNTRLKADQIPSLRVDPNLTGVKQNYNPQSNAISISKEVHDQLLTGNASQKAIENLAHELVHAVQFKFGEVTNVAKANRKNLLTPNAEEARFLGANIEQSTNAGTPAEASARRKLEADAYTFAYRNKDQIFAQVQRENQQRRIEDSLGVGGGKASLEITSASLSGFKQLQRYSQSSPLDITHGLQESISQIEAIRSQVLSGLQKLDNLDLLGTDQIEKIQAEILLSVKKGVEEIQLVTGQFKEKLKTNPELLQKPFNPAFETKELEKVTVARVQQQNAARPQTADVKATANLKSISENLGRNSEQEAIDKVKATSDYFVQSYKKLKESIARGGKQAQQDLDLFIKGVSAAQTEIDSIVSGLKNEGVDVNFAKSLGGKLQGLKGQLSLKANNARRLAQKSDDPESLASFENIQSLFNRAKNAVFNRQQIDPDVLMSQARQHQSNYNEAEVNIGSRFDNALEQVNASLANMGQQAETTTSRIKRIIQANLNPDSMFSGFLSGIKNVSLALLGFGAFGLFAQFAGNLARETTKAGLELDSLERKFKMFEGSSDKGDSKLKDLREQSDDLGVSFKETAEAYAQFASVTRDTPLEGVQTKQISESLSIAEAANGLSNARQKLVNTGFAQLLSKGQVSQEEVRGQISESMPGFIQVAARSYGVSVPELNRMIKSGLDSSEFAVRVSQQMQAEFSGASLDAAKSPQASLNRFQNAQEELTGRIGQKFLGTSSFGAEAAAKAINLLSGNIDRLLQLLSALSLTAASFGLQGLIGSSGLLGASLTFVSTAAKALIANLSSLLPVLGRFVLITAVLEAFKLLQTALSTSSGQFGEFADASEKALKKYEDALSKANGTQTDFLKNLPTNANNVKGKSYLEDTIVGAVIPKDWLRGFAGFVDQANDPINKLVGKDILKSRARRDNEDQLNALDKNIGYTDKIIQAVQEQVSGKASGLQSLVQLDKQIEEIQARRRALAATAKDPGLRNPEFDLLKDQENALVQQRQKVLEPVASVQAAIAGEIENLEKARDALRDKAKEGSITSDQYNQKMSAVTERLGLAKAAQDSMNQSLRDSLSKLSAFERAWQRIGDILADATKQLEINASLAQTQVYSKEASGGQSQATSDNQLKLIQRDQLIQQNSQQRAALAQMQAELNSQNAGAVLGGLGVNGTTRQAQLKTLADKVTGEQEKKILNSYSEFLTLRDQIQQGETQIAQAKVESTRQIRDLSKSVAEFFRSIQRSSESLALDLKSMDLETKLLGVKTKIKGAFSGFYTTFVDEFADGLIQIFEMSQEQIKNQIDAQKQIQQRLQGLDDTLRQAGELSLTIPGLGVGAGSPQGGGQGLNTSGYQVWSTGGGSAVISDYGQSRPHHDYQTNPYGQEVRDYTFEKNGKTRVDVPSISSGVISFAGVKGGYGNAVLVKDDTTGEETLVGHLEKIHVKTGQRVSLGQSIGVQGSTGKSEGDHVHLEASRALMQRYITQVLKGGFEQTASPTSSATQGLAQAIMTRTRSKDEKGLEKLLVTILNDKNEIAFQRYANSGSPRQQDKFGSGGSTVPDTRSPLEFGRYKIGDTVDSGLPGVGAKFLPIDPQFATKRSALGFHFDADRGTSPGSAGCIVFKTEADFIAFQKALAATGVKDFQFTDGKTVTQRVQQQKQKIGGQATFSGVKDTFGFDSGRVNKGLQYFMSQGVSPKAAAYLMSNFMQESGGHGWEKASNGSHYGIGQWSNDRINAVGSLPKDFMGQLQFALKDASLDSPDSLATFKSPTASDAQIKKAIVDWMRYGSNEEGSRFKYAKGLTSQLKSGAVISPTTGVSQASVEDQQQINDLAAQFQGQISEAQKIAIADAEKFNDTVYQQLAAKNSLSSIQIEGARKKNLQRIKQGQIETEKGVIDQERRLADIRNNLGDSTPETQLKMQLLGVERQRQDSLKDVNPQYEKLTESLEHAKSLLTVIGSVSGFEDQTKALRQSIPELERLQRHLKAVKTQIDSAYGAQSQDLIDKFNRSQREARLEVEATFQQSKVDLMSKLNESWRLNVRGQAQQSQFDFVSGLRALPSIISSERATLNQKLLELEQQKREGKLTNEEFEKLKINYIQISRISLENAIKQTERLKEAASVEQGNFAFNQYQQVFESQSRVMTARKSSYQLYGLQTQTNIFDKESQGQQIEYDYKTQIKQLNELMRSGQIASGTALDLKKNLEDVRKIQLDNLSKQFDPMTKAIGDTRNAFQGLLTDLFSGQKGFLSSLGDFFKNVESNLFGQFAQEFTDEIFGGFLKKNKKTAKDDAQGFGTLGVYSNHLNVEEEFPMLVQTSAQNFLQFVIDASNEIRQAGYDFASLAVQGESQGGLFDIFSDTIDTQAVGDVFGESSPGSGLIRGATQAAQILTKGGESSGDSLVTNLSKNIPGLIGDVVGLFGGGTLSGKSGGGSNIFGSILGIASKLFGFAEGGIIAGTRSKADDQLILAQKGEAVLTHRAVDLLGARNIRLINKGILPEFAEGGILDRPTLGLAVFPDSRSQRDNLQIQSAGGATESNTTVQISVTINNDGSATVTGDQGDLLGAKLSNAVKAVLISEKRPGGILGD